MKGERKYFETHKDIQDRPYFIFFGKTLTYSHSRHGPAAVCRYNL